MSNKLTINTDEIQDIKSFINSIATNFSEYSAQAFNVEGPMLSSDAVGAIEEGLQYLLPHDVIADGIHDRAATIFVPEYAIETDQTRFPYVRWYTREDDRVCPVCAPLHGQLMTEAHAHSIDVHGGHIGEHNCRCFLLPVDLGSELIRVAPPLVYDTVDRSIDNVLGQFLADWARGP